MDTAQKLKAIGYFMIFILILNLILFSFRLINWMVFWAVIIIGALFVVVVLPRVKKNK